MLIFFLIYFFKIYRNEAIFPEKCFQNQNQDYDRKQLGCISIQIISLKNLCQNIHDEKWKQITFTVNIT